ncbi:MAG: PAS domain-containing protein [Gammaproteobacteria bacterium]
MEATDSSPDITWDTGSRQSVLPEPVLPSPSKPSGGELVSPRGPLWAVVTGYASVVVGLLVLVGWAFDIETFKSVLPNAMAMKPNTAAALMALGLSMIAAVALKPPYVPSRKRILVARVLALPPLLLGTLTLVEYLTNVSLGIDQLLFRDAVISRGGSFPGRISPATSTSIILLGISFLLLDATSTRLRRFSQWPALIAAAISFVAVLGYLYGAQQLYQIRPYASVSFHTALLVVALGVGFVLARPDRSIARELFSQHHGGLMARRVLPLAILLPMIVGWLRLQGQRAGWYETEAGLALFASANVVIFGIVIWLAARTLNRVDADRRGADFRRLQVLREAETRWRALIEASAQIVWTAGANGEPDNSPSLRAFTGQSVEQLQVDGMKKVVHPDDLPRMEATWKQAIATRTAFEGQFRLRHVSREWRWVTVRAVPVEPTPDSPVAWVGMNRDITGRKHAEALADGQKQVLEMIARGAPLTETLDKLLRVVEAQFEEMYCSILILDPDGKHLRTGAAPRLPEPYTKAIDGAVIGAEVGSCGTAAFFRRPVYVEDILVDPLWTNYKHLAIPHGLRACWSTPIIDLNGHVLGTFAIYYLRPGLPTQQHLQLIDLATHTAAICLGRHKQMQALRDSEHRFRQLAESLPQLVWTCGPDGYYDYLSRQWLDYTGMPAIAQLGFGWRQQLHPADKERVMETWASAVAQNTEFRSEFRLRRHDGTYRWFDTRAVPLYSSKGDITKWIGSNTDIDDRKRLEEAQLRSQKLESLGTLAGGIAHDFNNMLLVIQGNAQLAQELIGKDSAAQEYLVEISHASERASDLVRRILSFSRPQKQKARHKGIQLGPAVEEALKFARAALPAMVEIRANVSARVPAVAADATQIHQIVLNLATNAAHALAPRGGLIEIELTSVEVDPTAVACGLDGAANLPAGQYARLTVRDNGTGMSAEVVERIFDPFFTTKPPGQGTGLGLSIVHGIMRSCGGAVTVQSVLGNGTSFHLFFPAAPEASFATGTETATGLSRGMGQRVLFIDDEDAVVRLGTLNLTRLGYRVTGCTDPAAALKEFLRDPEAIDVVVTDLSMPGMSGFDCAREMLAIRPDLPIVLTSGYVRPEDEARARDIGIRAVCSKPAALNELGKTLGEVMGPASRATLAI